MKPLIVRNKSFGALWFAQLLSQGGSRFYTIALFWWIIEQKLPNSGRTIGFLALAASLPALLFAKRIGALVDRMPSRKVLVGSDLVACAIVAVVGLLLAQGELSAAPLLVLSFLLASAQAFFDPTLNKSVAEVVSSEDLEEGVAFVASTGSVASFAGAVAGALFIESVGMIGAIAINALSYLLSAIVVSQLNFRPQSSSVAADDDGKSSLWKPLHGRPLLKRVLWTFAAVNLFSVPVMILLPVYAKDALGGSAATLAFLESALWLGFVAGTLGAQHVAPSRGPIFIGAVNLTLFGVTYLVLGLAPDKNVAALALVLAGFFLSVNNVKFITLFQRIIPAEQKGRFFALLNAVCGSTVPLSFAVTGFLIDHFTPTRIFLALGVGVMLMGSQLFPLRSRQHELQQEGAAA